MHVSMDWAGFGAALVRAVIGFVFVIGMIGLGRSLAEKARARLGHAYGIEWVAWALAMWTWVAVVSGTLSFGG